MRTIESTWGRNSPPPSACRNFPPGQGAVRLIPVYICISVSQSLQNSETSCTSLGKPMQCGPGFEPHSMARIKSPSNLLQTNDYCYRCSRQSLSITPSEQSLLAAPWNRRIAPQAPRPEFGPRVSEMITFEGWLGLAGGDATFCSPGATVLRYPVTHLFNLIQRCGR
jgi:hypothetical protein